MKIRVVYKKNKLAKVLPSSVHDGYLPVTSATTLILGMLMKADKYGDWEDTADLSRMLKNMEESRIVTQRRESRGICKLKR